MPTNHYLLNIQSLSNLKDDKKKYVHALNVTTNAQLYNRVMLIKIYIN